MASAPADGGDDGDARKWTLVMGSKADVGVDASRAREFFACKFEGGVPGFAAAKADTAPAETFVLPATMQHRPDDSDESDESGDSDNGRDWENDRLALKRQGNHVRNGAATLVWRLEDAREPSMCYKGTKRQEARSGAEAQYAMIRLRADTGEAELTMLDGVYEFSKDLAQERKAQRSGRAVRGSDVREEERRLAERRRRATFSGESKRMSSVLNKSQLRGKLQQAEFVERRQMRVNSRDYNFAEKFGKEFDDEIDREEKERSNDEAECGFDDVVARRKIDGKESDSDEELLDGEALAQRDEFHAAEAKEALPQKMTKELTRKEKEKRRADRKRAQAQKKTTATTAAVRRKPASIGFSSASSSASSTGESNSEYEASGGDASPGSGPTGQPSAKPIKMEQEVKTEPRATSDTASRKRPYTLTLDGKPAKKVNKEKKHKKDRKHKKQRRGSEVDGTSVGAGAEGTGADAQGPKTFKAIAELVRKRDAQAPLKFPEEFISFLTEKKVAKDMFKKFCKEYMDKKKTKSTGFFKFKQNV